MAMSQLITYSLPLLATYAVPLSYQSSCWISDHGLAPWTTSLGPMAARYANVRKGLT